MTVYASGISGTGATIYWTTDEGVDSQVEYGLTASYGSTSLLNVSQVLNHAVGISSLTDMTVYHYRVRSRNSSGNLSVSSDYTFNTSSAPDTSPPSPPSGLNATPSFTQINLLWTASIDNVGVGSYLIERCSSAGCNNFAFIGSSSFFSYTDGGLIPGTSYTYRIRAIDAAGNVSNYSNAVTATTTTDTVPPTTPTNLTMTQGGNNYATLSWTDATDNAGVIGYWIERCMEQYTNSGTLLINCQKFYTTSTIYFDRNFDVSYPVCYYTPCQQYQAVYRYHVQAVDAAGNSSPYSSYAGTYIIIDNTPPNAVTGFTSSLSSGQINVYGTYATDNTTGWWGSWTVKGYWLERCEGIQDSSRVWYRNVNCKNYYLTNSSYGDTNIWSQVGYTYNIWPVDNSGNLGASVSTVGQYWQMYTNWPNPLPVNNSITLAISGTSFNQINLEWEGSWNNGSGTYQIERCQGYNCTNFNPIAKPPVTLYTTYGVPFTDSGLIPGTVYSYKVKAFDSTGTLIATSNIATTFTTYYEGFNDGYAKNWNEISGTWEVFLGEYSQNNNSLNNAASTFGNNYGDLNIQAKINLFNGTNDREKILFRY
ncbi:MAG: fibronectin type III domain-containing protein [Nitrospirae bacterium]|nr:fibronectin type III domain-containing protein [Nitrospirota bacterium]